MIKNKTYERKKMNKFLTTKNIIGLMLFILFMEATTIIYLEYAVPYFEKKYKEKELIEKEKDEKTLKKTVSLLKIADINNLDLKNKKRLSLDYTEFKNLENLDLNKFKNKINDLESIELKNSSYEVIISALNKNNKLKSFEIYTKNDLTELPYNKNEEEHSSKKASDQNEKRSVIKDLDISFLTGKKELVKLAAPNVKDLSPLSSLKSVKNLTFYNYLAKDVNALLKLEDLEQLTISSKTLEDISGLNNIKKGEIILIIDPKKIKNKLSADSYLCQEKKIYLKKNKEKIRITLNEFKMFCEESKSIAVDTFFFNNLEEIEDLSSIKEIKVSADDVNENLSLLTSLKTLTIENGDLNNFSFLDNFPGLENLIMNNIKIGEIKINLPYLKNIKKLSLINIEGVDNVFKNIGIDNKLEALKIIHSDLSKITPALFNLKELIIEDAPLNNISFLRNSEDLLSLSIINTSLKNLKGLENSLNIENISLLNNIYLNDISSLRSNNIKKINIDRNSFAKKIKKDSIICLDYNTFCEN